MLSRQLGDVTCNGHPWASSSKNSFLTYKVEGKQLPQVSAQLISRCQAERATIRLPSSASRRYREDCCEPPQAFREFPQQV